jgi:hypothetical protein
MNTSIDVTLILWNKDVIQLVTLILLHWNLRSIGVEPSEGPEKIEDLIASSSPAVVVYDLDPPYDRSAAVTLRLLDRFPECSFVMTCADPALALKSAPWLSGHPVFQKPYELDEVAYTVASMVTRASKSLVAFSR